MFDLVLLTLFYNFLFQELAEVNTNSRRLFSHFIQIPSVAMQIKDIMLSAPPERRQQLQVSSITVWILFLNEFGVWFELCNVNGNVIP